MLCRSFLPATGPLDSEPAFDPRVVRRTQGNGGKQFRQMLVEQPEDQKRARNLGARWQGGTISKALKRFAVRVEKSDFFSGCYFLQGDYYVEYA